MIDLRALVAAALGAAIGGTLRYLVIVVTVARLGAARAPLGTFAINVVGSFAIGIVLELALGRGSISPLWRTFLATGIIGGFTTFSTFSFEALALARGPGLGLAAAYVVASVGLGIGAAILGIALVRSA